MSVLLNKEYKIYFIYLSFLSLTWELYINEQYLIFSEFYFYEICLT